LNKDSSFWNELRIVLEFVTFAVLAALNFMMLIEKLHLLSLYCANSKRKRLPSTLAFSLKIA